MNVPALLIVENLIDRSARSDRSVATAAFALLAVASLLPTLLTPIPAMGDYVNHVVRMQLLSQMGTPNANPYYEAAWAFYPNLAMDLVVPSMARLIGAENATRLFLLFTQMLIVGGALALEWAVKRRVHLAGFAALLFLYCLPFTWGFVNFESALAIALWGIAAYLLAAERPASVRCAVNTVFVVVLFTAHFFALGIYGATLGLYELWRAFDRKVPYNDVALRLATLALPAAALLVVMRLTAGSVGSEGTFWNFDHKLPWLFFIMNGYNMAVSGASAIVLMTALYLAISCGMLKLQPAGIWIASGFGLLYLAIPPRLFGTAFADIRILPAAALILPAFCSLSLPNRRWRMTALAIVGGITLANLAIVLEVWLSYRSEYSAMIASFQKINPGSKVLIGITGETEDPPFEDLTQYPMYYAPTLAVHYANAFVPHVFTETGKQPIQTRAGVRRLSIPNGAPVPIRVLSAIATGQKTALDDRALVRTWYRDYDYLYLLGTGTANPLPEMLKESDRSGRFVLYQIRRKP
ncbi:hypothetical protein I6F20_30625 [Bradyrhizobium sp. IC3123]|uniref:hypothetical protein n=1 Tax=Bradyrhizobium sp. IC3123 TaxID=2793803 RepID=UPI001CD362CB|nr:hypothetical protein [Bradyrhizobium sp. IC3123]